MAESAGSLLLTNALLFDGHSAELTEGASVLIEDGRIREVADRPLKSSAARTIDLGGKFLMPGLIDAHFHAYGISLDVRQFDQLPLSLLAHHAGRLLHETLLRGYTTVRDAAGADYGLARAVELGLIKGPRIFFAGRSLSQTGGHGDLRPADQVQLCSCGYSGTLSVVVDGEDEVRKAAREELRRGANQLKIMVSGGVLSPTDPIWMPQFTEGEIRAVVEEAATRRTYVMAHAHTSEAVRRCIQYGVRSIEHATLIDAPTAQLAASSAVFLVPTLAIVAGVMRLGTASRIPDSMMAKMREASAASLAGFEHCVRAGAHIGFGTDMLGALHEHQSSEFVLRREVSQAIDILRSATSVNAALLMQEGQLGCVRAGAHADLIAIDGNPLEDISLFERSAQSICLIAQKGILHKNTLQ